jgi:hypothetical protein
MSGELPFHEIAAIFPLMDGEAFGQLKADIAEHGLRVPLWTYRGKLIDGRNRYRACRELGIEPKTQEWDGRGSLVAFVWSLNGPRRHLSKSQLAALAVDMLPLLAAEAKERQRHHGKTAPGKKKTHPANVPEVKVRGAGEARTQAAQVVGASPRYVGMAKTVKEANPELFGQVRSGKLNLHQATNRIRQREKDEKRQREAEAARDGAWWWLPNFSTWAGWHSQELRRQVEAEPEFAARQMALEEKKRRLAALQKELAALQKELAALQREVWDEQGQLSQDIFKSVTDRHGYPGRRGRFVREGIEVRDPATRAELEAAKAAGDGERLHDILSRLAGECRLCMRRLGPRDNCPDTPGQRHAFCWWCRERRGKSHCSECLQPLDEGEEGRCWDCDPDDDDAFSEEKIKAFLAEW